MRLAERGLYTVVRNNPRVGCVLVKDGNVIGRGWHSKDGGPHAEVQAIRSAKQSTQGATVYVSLEPCCITGRTPPCTDALVEGGIARVLIAMRDPNPDVSGRGIDALRAAGIEVAEIETQEAEALNPGFVSRMRRNRPWVRIKSAISLDGRTAMRSGESKWLTRLEARADVQKWRARSGAIVTGIGTVLHDDPRLTVRDSKLTTVQPLRVVLDSKGRIPAESAIFKQPGETVVVVGSGAAPTPQAKTKKFEGVRPDLGEVVHWLGEIGINEVLVEAGSTLAGAFAQASLWDEWIIYTAAKILGRRARPLAQIDLDRMRDAIQGEIVSVETFGPDVRVILRNPDS